MSDDYIRLIPADKNWQPAAEAAAAAAAYVTGLFSGPDGDVEEVVTEFFDQVTLRIIQGAVFVIILLPGPAAGFTARRAVRTLPRPAPAPPEPDGCPVGVAIATPTGHPQRSSRAGSASAPKVLNNLA